MPKTALIIEDDEGSAGALQALCEKLGLQTLVAKSGKEGLELAAQKSPELILLDLLLPGLDGFKVAEALKAAKSGAALIAITGMYKDPKVIKDFKDKFGADYFLKPLKVDELTATLCRRAAIEPPAAAVPAPAVPAAALAPPVVAAPMQGSLADKPYPALMMELCRAKATGTLDLVRGQMRKRIFLESGQIRYAQSNLKSENVGGMQVAEGTLSEERFAAAVARARAERIGLGEALALSGDISFDDLERSVLRQVEEVCTTAFEWTDGTFAFAPGPVAAVQEARRDPVAILLAAFKRYVKPEEAANLLAPLSSGAIGRALEFDRHLNVLRQVFSGETVTPTINGKGTVAQVVAKARPADLPLVIAVVRLGLASVVGQAPERPAAAPAAHAPSAGPDRPYTPQEEKARAEIAAEFARVEGAKNLFAVLGVKRDASIEEVKAAYRALAKRYHTDAYAGMELGEAADQLRDLFAKVSDAHTALGDPKRRADYLTKLEREEAGLPTDVEVIFKAEAIFSRGDALAKQGRFSQAVKAFKEALQLDPSVAQYHIALAGAYLKGRGAAGAADAHEALDKALKLSPESVPARLLMAQVLEFEGKAGEALDLIDTVLAQAPDNREAMRERRGLRERMKAAKNKGGGGLLDKLFKK